MTQINIMDSKFIPSVIPDLEYPITRPAVVEQDGKTYYVSVCGHPIPKEGGNFMGTHHLIISVKSVLIDKDGKEAGVSYRCYDHLQYAWLFRDTLVGMDETDSRVKEIKRYSLLHNDFIPLLKLSDIPHDQMSATAAKTFKEMGVGK